MGEEDQIRVNMRILNAYYLPQGGSDLLYDSITPVNTFRIISNFYLGANYELLLDKSYMSSLKNPYVFREVTELLREWLLIATILFFWLIDHFEFSRYIFLFWERAKCIAHYKGFSENR